MCLTLPEVLVSVVGIEKVVPTWAGPRRVPAAAAALVDRRADEPLHLDLVRGHARRRAAGGARRAARQRPHPRARRRGRPAGAALHPLLGLPERLPGLRAGRRARLRLGLPRPDRRDPQPAAQGRRASTRRSTRCPTPPRCAAPASRSARCASTSRRCWCDLRAQVVDAHRGDRAQGRGAGHEGGRRWAFGDAAPARRCGERARRRWSAGSGRGRRTLPGGRRALGRLPGPGAALDRRPRPAAAAGRVVPGLVEAHRRDEDQR